MKGGTYMENNQAFQLDRVDFIMDNFDFSRVARTMELLEWIWASSEGAVPDESEIRFFARQIMKEFISKNRENGDRVSTGGFQVSVREDELVLEFVLEEWSA
jgi:hypothetical protein